MGMFKTFNILGRERDWENKMKIFVWISEIIYMMK
jgi:hypothetical protein